MAEGFRSFTDGSWRPLFYRAPDDAAIKGETVPKLAAGQSAKRSRSLTNSRHVREHKESAIATLRGHRAIVDQSIAQFSLRAGAFGRSRSSVGPPD